MTCSLLDTLPWELRIRIWQLVICDLESQQLFARAYEEEDDVLPQLPQMSNERRTRSKTPPPPPPILGTNDAEAENKAVRLVTTRTAPELSRMERKHRTALLRTCKMV